GACQWSGAAITSASSSFSATTRRTSRAPAGALPHASVTAAAPLATARSSTSQIHATSAPSRRANPRASAVPRLLVPMTASTTRFEGAAAPRTALRTAGAAPVASAPRRTNSRRFNLKLIGCPPVFSCRRTDGLRHRLVHELLRWVDLEPERGGDNQHRRNRHERRVIGTVHIDQIAEGHRGQKRPDLSCRVHGPRHSAGILAPDVEADSPGYRKHEVRARVGEPQEDHRRELARGHHSGERKEGGRGKPRHSDRAAPPAQSDAPHQAIADDPAGQVGQATKTEWDPTVMSEVGVAEATPLGQE